MRNALLLSAIPLLLAPPIAWGQAESALNATRVKDFIIVSPSGASILFGVDAPAKTERLSALTPNQVFSVRTRGLNLMLAFQNPLKVTWTVTSKDGPDPLVASVEKFLTSANAIATGLLVPTPTGGPTPAGPGASEGSKPGGPRAAGVPPGEKYSAFVDPALLEWGKSLDATTLTACGATSTVVLAPASKRAKELDQLVNWDRRSGETSIQSAGDFRAAIAGALEALLAAGDMQALKKASGEIFGQLASIEGSNRSARALLTLLADDNVTFVVAAGVVASNITGTGSGPTGNGPAAALQVAQVGVAAISSTATCPLALMNSRDAIASFMVRASRIVDTREALVSELRTVAAEIKARLENTRLEDKGFKIGSIEVTSGKRTTATLTLRERNVSIRNDQVVVEDGKSQSVTFEVMEHQSLVPEFVPGLAYSQVSFRRYKTNDSAGVHIVADGGDYQPHTIPMGMLNLMPNTGWSGFTRLVGQVGVGVTKESVVVLTGAGIRFSQPMRFVLSVGALFPFEQELTDLKLGSVVAGEAALQKDLQRTIGKPSLYIAIQK